MTFHYRYRKQIMIGLIILLLLATTTTLVIIKLPKKKTIKTNK